MSTNESPSNPPRNPRNEPTAKQSLHAVLAEYIRRRDGGESVSIEDFCRAYPELEDGLRSYAEGEGLLASLNQSASVDSDDARSAETIRPGAAHRSDFAPQAEFGRYRLLRQLGNGAMGAVYLAEDTQLGRRVALKIPTRTGTEGPEFLKRFTREAQAAAQLEHINLCRIYDFGDVNGTPFISMEYIDGPPLSQCVGTAACRDQRRIAQIVSGIATGLHCAHQRGILHRDVKSSNVLMKQEETPCVTDFGLARVEGLKESKLTHEGSILGTPAYMAPEQIRSDQDRIGPHSDVYALGVVLYELLAGHTPFQGSTLLILNQALNERPRPLQKVRSDVDTALADFCLRMLEKAPEKRPQTMQEVVDFLQRWLKTTSPESQTQRARAELERVKYEAMKASVLELVQRGQHAQAVDVLEKLKASTGATAKEYAEWARAKLPEVRKLPQQLRKAIPDLLATAKQCIRAHDYAQAAQLLQDIPEDFRVAEVQQTLDKALALQEESDLLLLALQECVRTRQFEGIDDNLKRFLKLKPGNKFARQLSESLETYSRYPHKDRRYRFDEKGRLQPHSSGGLWDNWVLMGTLCFAFVFGAAYWGITIYLKDGDRTLKVEINDDWLREQGGTLTLDVDGREHTIAAGDMDVKVTFGEHGFSVRNGDSIVHSPQTFTIQKGETQILHIDASGLRLDSIGALPVPGSGQNKPKPTAIVNAPLTPLPNGLPGLVKELKGLLSPASAIAFSPDGQKVAAVAGKQLLVWDVDSEQFCLKRDDGWMSVIFDNTGKYLFVGNSAVRKLDISTGDVVARFPEGNGAIYSLAISSDGKLIAGHYKGGHGVHVWDAMSTKLVHSLPGGRSGFSSSAAFLPSGELITTDSGSDYGTRLWDMQAGNELHSFRNGGDAVTHRERTLSVAPDGKSFIVAVDGKSSLLVNVESQVGRQQFISSSLSQLSAPVFLPSGRHVVCGSQGPDKSIVIWSIETGEEIHQFDAAGFTTKLIAISPDGRFLASTGGQYWQNGRVDTGEYQIQIWRLPQEVWPKLSSGTPLSGGPGLDGLSNGPGTKLTGPRTDRDTKPDDSFVIDAPRTPLPDGPPGFVRALDGHTGIVTGLAFTPDGRTLVSVSATDETLRIWDIESSEPRHVIKAGIGYGTAIHPDGKSVLVSVLDYGGNHPKLYDISTGAVLAKFPGLGGPAYSCAFSPNGKYAAFETGEHGVKVYDVSALTTHSLVAELPGDVDVDKYSGWESAIEFLPDSEHVITCSPAVKCGTRLFHVPSKREAHKYLTDSKPSGSGSRMIAVRPDGKHFFIRTTGGGGLLGYDVARDIPTEQFPGIGEVVRYSPDGLHLIGVQNHDAKTGTPLILTVRSPTSGATIWQAALPEKPQPYRMMLQAVSPDGRYVVVGGMSDISQNRAKTITGIPNPLYVWRLPKSVWPKLASEVPTVSDTPAPM